MIKALVAKSLQGDARATTVLVNLIGRLFEVETTSSPDEPLGTDDLTLIEQFLDRQLADRQGKRRSPSGSRVARDIQE